MFTVVGKTCPSCGSRNTKYDYTHWGGWKVYHCFDCGTQFDG